MLNLLTKHAHLSEIDRKFDASTLHININCAVSGEPQFEAVLALDKGGKGVM